MVMDAITVDIAVNKNVCYALWEYVKFVKMDINFFEIGAILIKFKKKLILHHY